MENVHYISPETLTFDTIEQILEKGYTLELSKESRDRINYCRKYLDEKIGKSDDPIYGVNTGFGSLYNRSISKEDLGTLQKNLVMSHACGTGDEIPSEVTRLMLLLKIYALSLGNSGVQLATVERLIQFFNLDILPIVYEYGSLGASGDLAPLAHMSLPLIGMGEVLYKGEKIETQELYKQLKCEPIELRSKEGLALINGTQFMSAFATHCLIKAFRLSQQSDITGAISLDAFDGRIEPFNDSVNLLRKQKGQVKTARRFRSLLSDSELIKQQKIHIQDPYSFRCIPQVHGASKDAINYVKEIVLNEINAVTDNPTVIPEEDLVISAGNFHGQPLALALDFLSIALSELGSISERRTYRLLSGKRNLPSYLIASPGLNSGFMILQYTAASLVSKNKHLATPASVDSIESSQGQEDHVSMGANAATKAYRVVNNLERILAIELLTAAQALEFRRPLKSSSLIEGIVGSFREKVEFADNDKMLYKEIEKAVLFLRQTKPLSEQSYTEDEPLK
ncbi:MAG: histidine ammonia-lyase [Bacteroidales bacterium]